jgi:hypothetical protein
MSKTISNSIDLKQEVFHLERDMMKWRLKCRALEEELQNPMNIHRWRKLEGSDPELLDVLQKIQILQKRLIKQSSEAIERERQLKEAEKLYLSLKQVLAKQPGPGLREELTKTQQALKNRGDQLKVFVFLFCTERAYATCAIYGGSSSLIITVTQRFAVYGVGVEHGGAAGQRVQE